MTFLRFAMLLSLVLWVGGIVFFGAILAPTVFTVLPTHELAGRVVSRSLAALHWMGLACGVVYLFASIAYSMLSKQNANVLTVPHILIVLMIVLTLVSQLGISSSMNAMRLQMGAIDTIAPSDPVRVRFNQLHQWSTRVEMGVLALGLVVTYLTARLH